MKKRFRGYFTVFLLACHQARKGTAFRNKRPVSPGSGCAY
ncbi:hypothetical protein JOC69_003403 [Heliobacterium gestii]|nr:hypothetical protein [Heliomicrobium gestii]